MNVPAALMTFVLKLPHRPRSAVIDDQQRRAAGLRRRALVEQRVRRRIDARRQAVQHAQHLAARTGARAEMRSCARRSCDAATIFIALVICCVDLTARIRRRMSISEGMASGLRLRPRGFRLAGERARRIPSAPRSSVGLRSRRRSSSSRRSPAALPACRVSRNWYELVLVAPHVVDRRRRRGSRWSRRR